MSNLKEMLAEQEKNLKQVESNYLQIQGGINILKHLIEEDEKPKGKKAK